MKVQVILSWYLVGDLEKAKKFYGETLGLDRTFEMQGWAEFSHARAAAAIGLAQQPGTPGGATVVLRVENIDQARAELSRRDVKFDGDVEEIPDIVKLASFRDPFGNRLQLAQPGRSESVGQ